MRIRVNPDYCKGCNLCLEICPRKVFERGNEPNDRGYFLPKISNPEQCPNFKRRDKDRAVCEMCILTCPDQAITLEEEVEA